MTTRDDILQAVREWFKLANSLTDAQIIPSNRPGDRPALPYLDVNVPLADVAVGVDESRLAINGSLEPIRTTKGVRSGTVTVRGFGNLTSTWLEDATLALEREDVIALLDTANVVVINRGGVTDISLLLDTQIERRFLREFEISYGVEDTPEILIELETVEAVVTLESDVAPDLVVTIDITV